jgi:hypothetical protein
VCHRQEPIHQTQQVPYLIQSGSLMADKLSNHRIMAYPDKHHTYLKRWNPGHRTGGVGSQLMALVKVLEDTNTLSRVAWLIIFSEKRKYNGCRLTIYPTKTRKQSTETPKHNAPCFHSAVGKRIGICHGIFSKINHWCLGFNTLVLSELSFVGNFLP